jgi:hypothetical protein
MMERALAVRKSGGNVRSIDHREHMTGSPCWTDDARERVNDIIAQLPAGTMRELLAKIVANEVEQYTLTICAFAAPQPSLDEELIATLQDLRWIYGEALLNGFVITYQSCKTSDPSKTVFAGKKKTVEHEPPIQLGKKDAIQILGSTTLSATVEFRKHTEGMILKVTFKDTRLSFWLTDISGLKTHPKKKTDMLKTEPSTYWNSAKTICYDGSPAIAHISTSILDEAAQDAQHELLKASSIHKKDDSRGVYLKYIDRILGAPYWSSTGWGAQRNAGGLRCLFEFDDPSIGEDYVKMLTEKNRTNCKNSHPLLKELFDIMVKEAMGFKERVHAGLTRSTGMDSWDAEDFYNVLFGGKTKAETSKEQEEARQKKAEASKITDVAAQKRQEAAIQKKAAEEAAQKKAAEEAVQKKAAEVAAAQKKVAEEAAQKKVAEVAAAQKKVAEEAAQKKAAEVAAAQKKVAEEAAQKKAVKKPEAVLSPKSSILIDITPDHVVISKNGLQTARLTAYGVASHIRDTYTAYLAKLGDETFNEFIQEIDQLHKKYSL